MSLETDIRSLGDHLRSATRVTVLTGAGISAASGVPTFRGPGGLWKNFRPEDLATAEAFRRDPRMVWEWYDWRRQLIAAARPNRAHEILAAWSRQRPGFALVTQNVDGLHERAGTGNVIRFHGSIWEVRCWDSCRASPRGWKDDRVPLPELPPRCPHCGGLLRPGVVWFGEAIEASVLAQAEKVLDCDVCLVIGTSAVVYPAAGLAFEARRRGAFTVEINPDSASDEVDLAIAGKAENVLPALARVLRLEKP
jgi:NAD-dependent deacetylase